MTYLIPSWAPFHKPNVTLRARKYHENVMPTVLVAMVVTYT